MLGYENSIMIGLQGMFMRTWDYRGFLIEPVLASLEHIFDPKIWDFFQKKNFEQKNPSKKFSKKKTQKKEKYGFKNPRA